MKYLRSFLPAIFIASTVVAEPTAAQYFAPKVTTDSGYTQTLMLPDGTLEYVVSFTTVNDETNPYTWQVPANVSKINYLVVAGGGGGGACMAGGGGGAGGMLTGTLENLSDTSFNIQVGQGGNGGKATANSANTITSHTVGTNGENSKISYGDVNITAYGGGAGGTGGQNKTSGIGWNVVDVETGRRECDGSPGGSGGGAAGGYNVIVNKNKAIGGQPIEEGQGFKGGDRTFNTNSKSPGAGGGGAGASGTTVTGSSTYNHGGDGKISAITGESLYYAGGGGGASYDLSSFYGKGGLGGGGRGGYTGNNAGASGQPNTGGGGGGACALPSKNSSREAGNGGSGIVVLRYALNNDNFQGIVVHHTTTEKFGNPSPAYDIYKTIPSEVCTCPRFSDVSQGVRAVCVGWELWSKDGAATEPIRVFTDDYRTTGLTSDLTYSRESGEEGVVLKWKFIKEYYVSTVASCERGSLVADKSGWYREGDTIQVAITSMDNFIGWGGWGTSADRAFDLSKEITVVAAPMIITAYFTAHNKDNLVLNGDFEENKNPSAQNSIINGTGNLTAGNWERISSGYTSYNSGLVTTTAEQNSQVKSYSGLSAIICSSSAQTATRNNGTIKCTVHVPCSGLYDLSFMNDTGYNNSGMKGLKWNVDIDLITSNNTKTNELVNLLQKANMSWHQENFKVRIPRGGLYTLQFSVDRYSIASDPEASASAGTNASSAFDNIELKLDKRFGFAIMVR